MSQTWWLENGEIIRGTIHPTKDFGLPTHPLSSVRGATPDLNALTFKVILSGSSEAPPHLSAPASPDSPSLDSIRDYVLLNAAALLHVSGRAKDWKEGVSIARESIESGGARTAFEGFRDASKKAMGEKVDVVVVEDDGGVAAKNGFVKSWLRAKRGKVEVPASEDEGGKRVDE
jgi:anthranilate phosphoribosyltransferase